MQEIYVENIKEIIRSKNKLEKELKIKLTTKGKIVFVNGNAEHEYNAIEILKAINLGFSTESALRLLLDNINLQIVNIKDITKRNDLLRVRARIIGTQGRTLKTLNKLTKCTLSLHNNQIGIIGDAREIEDAIQSVTSLINGSKQGNVYGRLERQRKNKRINQEIIETD